MARGGCRLPVSRTGLGRPCDAIIAGRCPSRGIALHGNAPLADHSVVRTMSSHRPILMHRGQSMTHGMHMDTKALFNQRFDSARTALAEGDEPGAAEFLHWAIVAARSDPNLRRELAS